MAAWAAPAGTGAGAGSGNTIWSNVDAYIKQSTLTGGYGVIATGGAVSDVTGKTKEPLLRLIQFWRAYDAAARNGNYHLADSDKIFGEGPLLSPSVFNFFRPGYAPPGEIEGRSLTAPELQIATEVTNAALLELTLHTGRQHQIRLHLEKLGHPLIGERVYADQLPGARRGAGRNMLHAWRLAFPHPILGTPISVEADPPEDFQKLLARLRAGRD